LLGIRWPHAPRNVGDKIGHMLETFTNSARIPLFPSLYRIHPVQGVLVPSVHKRPIVVFDHVLEGFMPRVGCALHQYVTGRVQHQGSESKRPHYHGQAPISAEYGDGLISRSVINRNSSF
jgi:hypothetical protein